MISHSDMLFILKRWQIRAALRGYYRRQRATWETARFIGLVTASCNRDPKKPPLTATALLPLPWDVKPAMPPEEEIEELRRLMDEENARLENETPQQ